MPLVSATEQPLARPNRRADIEEAIQKAKGDVPALTDFVLCLRELPAKTDVDWYFGLDVGLRLHLWADEEIETRLTGDAEVLRRTYFSELVLTVDQQTREDSLEILTSGPQEAPAPTAHDRAVSEDDEAIHDGPVRPEDSPSPLWPLGRVPPWLRFYCTQELALAADPR